MAIFSGPPWPSGAVPYRLDGAAKGLVQGWINRLNGRLQRTVFIPYLPFHGQAHVTIRHDPQTPESQAGDIGYQGEREHRVTVADEARLIHELLHVLGFRHEQYHPKYGWISAANLMLGDYNHVPPAATILGGACASDRDWNSLLVALFNGIAQAGDTSGGMELMKWAFSRDPQWEIDSPFHCDIWSAMMYRTCRKAVLLMRDQVGGAAHPSWRQKRDAKQLLNFQMGLQWIEPVLPHPARYNLSVRDKALIHSKYSGHKVLGERASGKWTTLTSRTGHYRSTQLGELDKALASCDIERIQRAFDTWYSNNREERTKRNRDNCVENLKQQLGEWVFA